MKIRSLSWTILITSPFLMMSLAYAKDDLSVSKAQEVVAALPEKDKMWYPVSSLKLEFVGELPDSKQLKQKLEDTSFRLSFTPVGILGPTKGLPIQVTSISKLTRNRTINSLYFSAIRTIAASLVETLSKEGYAGISIQVDPQDISRDGVDLRKPGNYTLRLKVVVGTIGKIQTVEPAPGASYKFNTANTRYILENAPVKVGDPLYKHKLDNYACSLSRAPHRRVDVQVHSLTYPNQIGVDFLVREARSWRMYGNVSNAGTTQIGKWQETVGYSNTNTTGIDDVFKIEGTSDSFNSFFNVQGMYEAPFFRCSKARWKIEGMHNHYGGSQFGFTHSNGSQGRQTEMNSELIYTLYQYGDLFVDGFTALDFTGIKNHNGGTPSSVGKTVFASPRVGFNVERYRDTSRLFVQLDATGSAQGFLASNRSDLNLMGRLNPSKSWVYFNFRALGGLFLDPLRLANEVTLLLQGQYAFNYRLIPQLQAVVGGLYTVRGYPNYFASGDTMGMFRAEYTLHLPQLLKPKAMQTGRLFGQKFKRAPSYAGDKADWDLAVKCFLDGAKTIYNQKEAIIEENHGLLSTGVGGEVRIRQFLILRGDVGIVLKEDMPAAFGTSRFYLNATLAY